jgi:hypothetical protein
MDNTAAVQTHDAVDYGTEESRSIAVELVNKFKEFEKGNCQFISGEESIRKLRESDPRA